MGKQKSKYRVLEELEFLSTQGESTWTTIELANRLDLSRGVVSLYLSQLLEEGLVEKSGTKPVYWQMKQAKESFSEFIGYSGSLQSIIEDCKSAVNYPPDGFPLIITGESGVGKSFLATLIYQYAKECGKVATSAEFVSLNCADYANNPELLSSVLFGYRKGAFTGAENDSKGLVAKADGGYLFLDEIHRLNNENQEKLFTLLDTGQYYPLGENEVYQKAKIRFIFATTESLEDSLLSTFRRRIPMTVALPPYEKRPLREKMELIFDCFKNEGQQMGRQIDVSEDFIFKLLNLQDSGNIGTLKNKIKIECAKAYNNQLDKEVIRITDANQASRTLRITSEEELSTFKVVAFLEELARLLSHYDKENLQNYASVKFSIKKLLKPYKKYFIHKNELDAGIQVIVDELEVGLAQAHEKYGVFQDISEENKINAAILIYCLNEQELAVDTSQYIFEVKKLYPRSFYLIDKLLLSLNQVCYKWNRPLLNGLLLFLLIGNDIEKVEEIPFLGILLSHGKAVASSIQELTNSLSNNFVFESFDMPLDVSMAEISHQVKQYVHEINGGTSKGVILLFDMGSLSQMYKEIKKVVNLELVAINNLTASYALDMAFQIVQKKTFKEIAENAEIYPSMTEVQYYEGISQNKNIIVSCMSGVGLSEEIKLVMKENLNQQIELITRDYKDLKHTLATQDSSYFSKTKFIITTTDFGQNNEIPIINIYDIMEAEGAKKFEGLLLDMGETSEAVAATIQSLLNFFTIEGISKRLKFLNPQIVTQEVQEVIEKYEQYYGLNLDGKTKLSLYMHIALMIERMLLSSRKNEFSDRQGGEENEDKVEFFSVSKNIFRSIEIKYNIVIDDYEISLMYELLKYSVM